MSCRIFERSWKPWKDGNSYCPENTISCNNLIGTHNCTCDDGLYFENKVYHWLFDLYWCQFRVTIGITLIGNALMLTSVFMNLTIAMKTQSVKILLVVFGVFVTKDTTSKTTVAINVSITTSVLMVFTITKLITWTILQILAGHHRKCSDFLKYFRNISWQNFKIPKLKTDVGRSFQLCWRRFLGIHRCLPCQCHMFEYQWNF